MKKYTKISIMLMISMLVMSMFLACGPNGGGNDGSGDDEDSGTVLFEEDFQSGNLDDYTVTDGKKLGSTNYSWEVYAFFEGKKNKMAVVDIGKDESGNFLDDNDTRLEFTSVDLTSYKKVTLKFDFWLSHKWSLDKGDGGTHVKDGGCDMQIMVKEGDGDWKYLCHEKSFTDFDTKYDYSETNPDSYKSMPQSVDLSAYAGKKDITVAFWMIGEDSSPAYIDNVKIMGE